LELIDGQKEGRSANDGRALCALAVTKRPSPRKEFKSAIPGLRNEFRDPGSPTDGPSLRADRLQVNRHPVVDPVQ